MINTFNQKQKKNISPACNPSPTFSMDLEVNSLGLRICQCKLQKLLRTKSMKITVAGQAAECMMIESLLGYPCSFPFKEFTSINMQHQ